MSKKDKAYRRKSFMIIISGFFLMILNYVQCYASDGENYMNTYGDQPVLSGKFIIFQNSLIIVMALIIIALLIIVALLINKYRKISKECKILKARDKITSDYIIIISHELRTPLNIIINSAKLLKDYLSGGSDVNRQYVIDKSEYIVNNSSRLLRTINNSIDAAMIESGVVSVHFENYNIVESIEDIITASQEYAQSNGISLIFDPQEEEIVTAIDRCKIERAMLNLISNSIKNIKGKGNIIVSCERNKDFVCIKVSDDGIGMSEFTQKHLFEKFYQSSPDILKRGHEGSGLGMYITYNLIKIHGGNMSVRSEINKGTTITISLPLRIVDNGGCDNITDFECDARERAKIEFSDIYR